MKEVEVCLNGKDWLPANRNCVDYIYEDSMPMLLIIVDEMAELTQKSGLKTTEAKEDDAMKDEIVSIITSIAQLGRSAAVHVLLATQKPNSTVVPTVLRSNPLSLDTEITTKEKIKKLRDVNIEDKILGTDGEFHDILGFTKEVIPKRMFKLYFSNGYVKCSDTHQWTYWLNGNSYTTETLDLFLNSNFFLNEVKFGKQDGPKLVAINEIEPEPVKCIITNTEDGLFEIYTSERHKIFTHNCGLRVFMGTAAETGASLVTLDNNLATTIDSSKPGMGIMQVNAVPVFFRSYFSKFEDLNEYYAMRGLDELGYSPGESHEFISNENLKDEVIETHNEKVEFDFDGHHAEIDKRTDQDWEEV